MISVVKDEPLAELDRQLGLGSLPRRGRPLPVLRDVPQRQPDQLGGGLIARKMAFVAPQMLLCKHQGSAELSTLIIALVFPILVFYKPFE